MSDRRPTVKEMKRDGFYEVAVETGGTVWDYLEEHWRRVLAVVGGLVLLAVGGYGYLWHQDRQEVAALNLMAQAMEKYQAIDPDPSTTALTAQALIVEGDGVDAGPAVDPERERQIQEALEAFDQVATAHPSREPGKMSRLYQAVLLAEQGKTTAAIDTLETLQARELSLAHQHLVTTTLAGLYEDAGQVDKAETLWKTVIEAETGFFGKDYLIVSLARLYERHDRLADARAQYQRLTDEFTESTVLQEATAKLGELDARIGRQSGEATPDADPEAAPVTPEAPLPPPDADENPPS